MCLFEIIVKYLYNRHGLKVYQISALKKWENKNVKVNINLYLNQSWRVANYICLLYSTVNITIYILSGTSVQHIIP